MGTTHTWSAAEEVVVSREKLGFYIDICMPICFLNEHKYYKPIALVHKQGFQKRCFIFTAK